MVEGIHKTQSLIEKLLCLCAPGRNRMMQARSTLSIRNAGLGAAVGSCAKGHATCQKQGCHRDVLHENLRKYGELEPQNTTRGVRKDREFMRKSDCECKRRTSKTGKVVAAALRRLLQRLNRAELSACKKNQSRNVRPEQQTHRDVKRPVQRLQVQVRKYRRETLPSRSATQSR